MFKVIERFSIYVNGRWVVEGFFFENNILNLEWLRI